MQFYYFIINSFQHMFSPKTRPRLDHDINIISSTISSFSDHISVFNVIQVLISEFLSVFFSPLLALNNM